VFKDSPWGFLCKAYISLGHFYTGSSTTSFQFSDSAVMPAPQPQLVAPPQTGISPTVYFAANVHFSEEVHIQTV